MKEEANAEVMERIKIGSKKNRNDLAKNNMMFSQESCRDGQCRIN